MKRLRLLILIFCLALSVPLAYFVFRTYQSLDREDVSKLRYFADTLFDEMEKELASIVIKEENRAVDEYNYNYIPPGRIIDPSLKSHAPLSQLPQHDYIIGYLQNNPDGSFQTPLVKSIKDVPADLNEVVEQLKNVNLIFNRKRFTVNEKVKPAPAAVVAEKDEKKVFGFADKYLNLPLSKKSEAYLGQKEKRMEQITADQALNIAQLDHSKVMSRQPQQTWDKEEKETASGYKGRTGMETITEEGRIDLDEVYMEPDERFQTTKPFDNKTFQVEVAPLQSVFINDDRIYIFRRIMINNQIYRQGFIINLKVFLNNLSERHFINQPMARFTNLEIKVTDQGRVTEIVQAGVFAEHHEFSLNRSFPAPFDFLNATLACDRIPRSAGRGTLNIMVFLLGTVVLMGLFAIYHSVYSVVDLSERRSSFVSTVTHELKTPLTNIRMYIEMLEQGIARDPEREQEYFRILGSESARLSRLINNVLELSKLEKKQRHFDLQKGTFEEVVQEVQAVMNEKLRQEGFVLKVEKEEIPSFKYDREAMIQVMINLIENSIKFGKNSTVREITLRIFPEGDNVKICVTDTGPGIPKDALKKIFDDFYRVDSSLTRITRGTGIGLALVKKLITGTGGSVTAENNDGPGCTIIVSIPKDVF
ncbi:MAG: HAMP domain-containing sensor histidine kinase [Thermodesulfobacteriota bacterium]|nr:HAMP domain-containing sensor histidine kinase [Thermodesulfobacteriota bacterium]